MQNFTSEELEITELPEREEMLLGLVKVKGLAGVGAAVGGLLGSLLPITVELGA